MLKIKDSNYEKQAASKLICIIIYRCLYTNELQLQWTRADKECPFRLIFHYNDIIKKYELHDWYLIHNHALDIQKCSKFNLATKRAAKKTTEITEVEVPQKTLKEIPLEMLNLDPVPEVKSNPRPEESIRDAINQAIKETLKIDIIEEQKPPSVGKSNTEGELILVKEKPFPWRVGNVEDLLKGDFWTAFIKFSKQ